MDCLANSERTAYLLLVVPLRGLLEIGDFASGLLDQVAHGLLLLLEYDLYSAFVFHIGVPLQTVVGLLEADQQCLRVLETDSAPLSTSCSWSK